MLKSFGGEHMLRATEILGTNLKSLLHNSDSSSYTSQSSSMTVHAFCFLNLRFLVNIPSDFPLASVRLCFPPSINTSTPLPTTTSPSSSSCGPISIASYSDSFSQMSQSHTLAVCAGQYDTGAFCPPNLFPGFRDAIS